MAAVKHIESSGTYKMLMEMRFDPLVSSQAAKIYLNDVESAVAYCCSSDGDNKSDTSDNESDTIISISSVASSSFEIHQQLYQPGSYFASCYDILRIKYPKYSSLFQKWFIEEEFDDNSLPDEFKQNEQYDQSFFIQFVEDNSTQKINPSTLSQMYFDLAHCVNLVIN